MGQISLGLPKGSAEGSTSGRFHQGPTKVPPRFRQSFTKVPPSSAKVLQVSWCLWFSGADLSWAAKRFILGCQKVLREVPPSLVVWGRSVLGCHKVLWKVPPSLLYICLPVPSTLSCIFLSRVSFGALRHSKGLKEKWHVCLLGFFAANGFRLPKGSLECSPNCSAHLSESVPRFLG